MKSNKQMAIIKWALFVVATLLVGCGDRQESNIEPDPHTIGFVSQGVASRGETNPDAGYELFADGSQIGVLAYNLPDGNYDPTLNTPDLLYDAELTKLGTGSYSYNPLVNWPLVGKVKFEAYYPHGNTFPVGTITLSPFNASGPPSIIVDLTKAGRKIDFATASLEELTPKTGADPDGTPLRDDYMVNFRFQRKMAELFFFAKAVDMPPLVNLYIHSVSIKNTSKKGTYRFASDSWEPDAAVDGTSGATLGAGTVGNPVDKLKYVDIINPSNVSGTDREASVVMIPNKYEVIRLSLLYTLEYMKPEGGCEYRIVGVKDLPLSVDWKAATMYTYYIDCGYYEAVGDETNLSFTVKKWTEVGIGTTMN